MRAQKTKVPYKIKIRRAQFHLGQMNDLRKVTMPVAPVEGSGWNAGPGAGGKPLPLFGRKVIQRQGAETLAAHHDL